MKPEEYERWQGFALRMARTCFQANRRPNSRWISGVVEDFFDRFDENDVPCVVDWDNSDEYPEGNPLRRREYHATYCGCDGKREEAPDPKCPECRGRGVHHAWISPHCVGDMVSVFLESCRGYAPACRACRVYEDETKCRCDKIEDFYYEQWGDQWGGPIHCCIRAGLDFAAGPSAGVLGFTAGDVRRMFPEGVPDWVFPPNERLKYFLTDELNGTFAELPDSVGVVL